MCLARLLRSKGILIISFLLCHELCQSQIRAKNSYRPKLAELSIGSLNSHHMTSTSEDFGREKSDKRLTRIRFKAITPLILKDSLKVGLQVSYLQQQFLFDGAYTEELTNFSSFLNNQNFKNISATLLVQKSLQNGAKLTLVGGTGYSGSSLDFNKNSRRYLFSALYQKQINAFSTLGSGLIANYNDIGFRVLPIISYERTLSSKWTLSTTLPRNVLMRYQVSNTSFLTAKAEVDGWRYNLGDSFKGYAPNGLNISRLDLNYSLTYEKSINDWLWLGVEAGWNQNLRYFVTASGDRYRDAIDNFSEACAPFAQFSLFLVVPSKFLK